MVPHSVECDQCGDIARVKGYGPISADDVRSVTIRNQSDQKIVELIIDCPNCGTISQLYLRDT